MRQVGGVHLPARQRNRGDGLQAIENRLVGVGRSRWRLRECGSRVEKKRSRRVRCIEKFTTVKFAKRRACLCIGKSNQEANSRSETRRLEG